MEARKNEVMNKYSNPWKTVSSKNIYTNPWLSLREDQVIRPDGQPGIYSVVETRIATGVIALTPEMDVYLVGQYRYPTECYSWEIVEGGTDDEETALAAIKRELQEEAGLLAAKWHNLGGKIHISNCISAEVARLFVATDLSQTQSAPDGTEVLEVRVEPFEHCLQMVERGEITDAMSIIALLRLEQEVRRGGWEQFF
ncbi:MAG: NUDIX hydrolase [Bdellovibrionales bacterium]|nr:NUDIX hydrolase [Bdellovibrionales bacterium]